MAKNNVAFIIDKIYELSLNRPGKKMLQKMVFLIERKGVDLNYDHGLHFYGPYSAELDLAITTLSTEGIIEIDYSGFSHLMSVSNHEEDVKSELPYEQEMALIEVIEHYKDWKPLKLELLTTAIYAYENLEDKSKNSVVAGVKKIKGEKYSEQEILEVIQEFSYFDIKIW